MTKIRKLPTEIVSKIAAGEVVERPMNVVKELVENSLDAGADTITITIAKGGKDLIRVQDNGSGIPNDELELAFQLHTTSKLENDDPSNVSSLGFRGEALASISAVSHIEVESKTNQDKDGKKLVLEGGVIKSTSAVTSKKGTSIQVSGIFYNTPARRKFLKTSATERKRITDLITNYCLMYPDIHFKLIEQNKSGITSRIESPSRKSMMAVIYDVLGPDIANDLIAIDEKIGDWQLSGYISKPSLTRSDRSLQFINVNGRPIRNKDLQATIEDAYGSQLMRKTHPVLVLKLEGPIESVDFNIHPQKSEIRFKSDETLFSEIPELILNTLSNEIELPPLQQQKLDRIKKRSSTQKPTKPSTHATKPSSTGKPNTKSTSNKQTQTNTKQQSNTSLSQSKSKPSKTVSSTQDQDVEVAKKASNTIQTSLTNEKISEEYGKYQVLGHIMNKFAVIFAEDELWLMDVHAADERVKFEMYAEGKERRVSSQQFLEPVNVNLSSSEKQLLIDHSEDLQEFGLKISSGGSTSVLIHSMPVYYDQEITPTSIAELLHDIITHLNDDDSEKGAVETPLDVMEYNIVARLACHGAVRSGYPVGRDKIKDVLKNLLKCEYPWTCAHGRPTIQRMSKSQLESLFKR